MEDNWPIMSEVLGHTQDLGDVYYDLSDREKLQFFANDVWLCMEALTENGSRSQQFISALNSLRITTSITYTEELLDDPNMITLRWIEGHINEGIRTNIRGSEKSREILLTKVLNRIPLLSELKRRYVEGAERDVARVLIPRDDPDFDTRDISRIVGKFLFKGKKSPKKSVRKSRKRSPKVRKKEIKIK